MNNIFDLLLEKQIISMSTFKMVEKFCLKWQISGFHGLLETNIFEETELADILAEVMKMDRIYEIMCEKDNSNLQTKIVYKRARQIECFPRYYGDNDDIEIIIADPTQRDLIAKLRQEFDSETHFSVGTRGDILNAIDKHYSIDEQLKMITLNNTNAAHS